LFRAAHSSARIDITVASTTDRRTDAVTRAEVLRVLGGLQVADQVHRPDTW
jgi:hypothetical protein